MPFGKSHDLIKVRTSPSVDALGVIANGHDLMVDPYLIHDLGLQGIYVLVLVDENVGKSILIILRGILIAG
jgi:RecA-family ATPase